MRDATSDMRGATSDPTAGERARAIREHPETPQAVVDPTDPVCGDTSGQVPDPTGVARRIVDPTDPACGEELA